MIIFFIILHFILGWSNLSKIFFALDLITTLTQTQRNDVKQANPIRVCQIKNMHFIFVQHASAPHRLCWRRRSRRYRRCLLHWRRCWGKQRRCCSLLWRKGGDVWRKRGTKKHSKYKKTSSSTRRPSSLWIALRTRKTTSSSSRLVKLD